MIHLHPDGEEAQTRGDHEEERGQPKRFKFAWGERIIRTSGEILMTIEIFVPQYFVRLYTRS